MRAGMGRWRSSAESVHEFLAGHFRASSAGTPVKWPQIHAVSSPEQLVGITPGIQSEFEQGDLRSRIQALGRHEMVTL
jgi:hypothetical protein